MIVTRLHRVHKNANYDPAYVKAQRHKLEPHRIKKKSFATKYAEIGMGEQKNSSFNINTFEMLGIWDPFPLENYSGQPEYRQPAHDVDLVYSHMRLAKKMCSPLCVYIPTKEIMFKIQRACIGVKKAEELWYHIDAEDN